MRAPRNKYGAQKTVIDGITFDSKAEANRYATLKLLERAGEISHLEVKPTFEFVIDGRPVLIRSEGYPKGRKAKYTADFSYWDGEKRVCEDVKGGRATATEAYKLRRAIVEAMHPNVRITEVTR